MEKLLALIMGLWLVCGATAGWLAENTRPVKISDVAMGPFSLQQQLTK